MAAPTDLGGWTWFEAQDAPTDQPERELCRAFARCFAGPEGALVLTHLERVMLNRRLPPEASDAALRHLEGQRYAIAYLAAMAARGRE